MFTKIRYCSKSFEPKGLSIAPKTLANFFERKNELYEQGADVQTLDTSGLIISAPRILLRLQCKRLRMIDAQMVVGPL